jgi:hypothetical protein
MRHCTDVPLGRATTLARPHMPPPSQTPGRNSQPLLFSPPHPSPCASTCKRLVTDLTPKHNRRTHTPQADTTRRSP